MISIWRSRQQAAFSVLSAVRHGAVAQGLASAPSGRASRAPGATGEGTGSVADRVLRPVHHHEAVAAELERLLDIGGRRGRWPGEPVGAAVGLSVDQLEVAAGEMERGLDVEVVFAVPQLVKGDPLGVAEEPGGFVIERGDAVLERPDAKRHSERAALRAQGAARRDSRRHGRLS